VSAHLAAREVTVRFGTLTALDAVDLDVPAGEVVVVLGPSGSGKSTLLRAVAGLQPLDGGQVLIDGDDVTSVPAHRRGVGMMFQDHALFPHLDVGANVAFGLRMQGVTAARAQARVAELLDLVGLPGSEGRVVQTLSGGEQQRVALARSLAPSPSALLLDEPLGALDRPLRERLVGELRQLVARLGVTVAAVTHDQAEAFALADALVVLDGGRVLQTGTPASVWGRPVSAQVARLLGFANVVAVSVAEGRLRTPWGVLGAVQGPAVSAVIRPEGVRLAPDGPIEGTVLSTTFAGARTRLRVAVAGAPDLEAEVAGSVVPVRGTPVRLAIDPTAVTPLAE
jgi:thiamine transport system ATP-binding protein